MGTNKLEFNIRMYTQSDRMCPSRVTAASGEQALILAMKDPQNNHYDKFGLVGRDNNCHVWEFRPGTPRRRPRGLGIFASSIQEARDRAHIAVTKQEPPPEAPPPTGPVIASTKELADVVMKHVLPQLSPKRPFKTEEVARLLPVQYASAWTRSQNVRSSVLIKLKEKGVITKYSHFEYMRAPEFVDRKLIEEEVAPPEVANGNGKSHAPEGPAIEPPAPPPALAARPPEARPAQLPLSSDEKVDAVLLMIRAIMSDRSQYKAEIDALSEELLNVVTQMDSIRAKLEALIKREQSAPMRFGELLDSMRRMPPPPLPVSAMAGAVLS